MLKYLLLIVSLSFGPWARGEAAPEAAAKAYENGNFAQAAELYTQLLETYPNSASLYHNLGSALYRNGELGAAVAAYLRAAQLEPRNPDIRFNLQLLLAKGSDKLEASLPAEGWRRLLIAEYFSEKELFYASILLFCGGCLGAGFALLRRRPLLLGSALLLLLPSLFLGINLIYKQTATHSWGAIRDPEVAAYSSPTEKNSVVIFQLHAGAPCALIEQSGEWYKIKLSDQKTGWVPRRSLVVFGAEAPAPAKAQPADPQTNFPT